MARALVMIQQHVALKLQSRFSALDFVHFPPQKQSTQSGSTAVILQECRIDREKDSQPPGDTMLSGIRADWKKIEVGQAVA
ncbi:hypothetical protein BTR14_00685 [Rhizobium rhizosphaerae]|uniref:Uncharacterized protein n=2 Tax=Xaviernesmea rhizosphaerae TaxID=1672749 RepID=A0ABX3PIP7_9HYPH|nr:hypothetical protein BTR14_00685 [Xaviernesmea rhizosphaerae]